MKVLKACLTLSLLYSTIVAEENLDSFLSKYKIEQFKYDYQKNESQSSMLRDSWIAPINLKYYYMKNNQSDNKLISKTTSISIDQPIFKSGGIYYGIKYSNASLDYGLSTIEASKQKLINQAISLLVQIKQVNLKIEKQNYRIKNADISLEIKKEQYLNGQLDSSFLDSAIIERNSVISSLYDMQTSKERLISNFETISDINYSNIEIPTIEPLSKDDFLKNNFVLNIANNNNLKNDFYKDMTIAKYLPSINLIAGYNWNELETNQIDTKDNYYNYGFRVNLPLNINTLRDIESSKVDYLKSMVDIKDKKRQMNSLYNQVMQNISNIRKKINLSKENKNIYKKLLDDTKKLYEVGYKTKYDVELLSNSFKIQSLDIQVLEIDEDLELLNLYESYKKSE